MNNNKLRVRAQLNYIQVPVNLLKRAEIRLIRRAYGADAVLYYLGILTEIAGITNGGLAVDLAVCMGEEYGFTEQKSEEVLGAFLNRKLLTIEGGEYTDSGIVEAQILLEDARRNTRERVRKHRSSNGDVTRYSAVTNAAVTPLYLPSLSSLDLDLDRKEGGPGGDSTADQQNGGECDADHAPESNAKGSPLNGTGAAYSNGAVTSESFVKSQTSEGVQSLVSPTFNAMKYLRSDEGLQNNTVFVNTGRRPMIDYPDLWLTTVELEQAIATWKSNGVAKEAYRQMLASAQSRALTQKGSGKDTSRIAAVNWLTSWVLQEHLKTQSESARLKKAQTPFVSNAAPGPVQNPLARKELVPSWAGIESKRPSEDERELARAALEKIKASTVDVGF